MTFYLIIIRATIARMRPVHDRLEPFALRRARDECPPSSWEVRIGPFTETSLAKDSSPSLPSPNDGSNAEPRISEPTPV